ncbi:MAG: dTDP-4-dehydrorhamnose 3,5-epimerase [Bacteroidetes bacterium]|nr:dTDP-4-dehydrorhamnose 3,5-epimerase [Bacteroidota bacterium]MBU1718604.1 dTDP-4-dehydrorhamnose 3,5-epimerase [Bacteroidota bacterium]
MEIRETKLPGVLEIIPKTFFDQRGCFFESYNEMVFHELGIITHFVQDNESVSGKNVLRGLHLQHNPFGQAKLVKVSCGAVKDVVVDIRQGSPSFGQHEVFELNSDEKRMLFIPEGFAHGFIALTDNTIFAYKCSNFYNRESEDCIVWNDPDLNIDWGISDPILAPKDACGKLFKTFHTSFRFS